MIKENNNIACTLYYHMSGQMLSPQALYTGKTDMCHPASVEFSADWDIFQSQNH